MWIFVLNIAPVVYCRTQSNDTVWDDTNPGIVYSPGWDSSPNSFSNQYFLETMQYVAKSLPDNALFISYNSRTNTANASASVLFTGNSISIYGCTSGNHGPFNVSVDGGTPLTLNGTISASQPRFQWLLVSEILFSYLGSFMIDMPSITPVGCRMASTTSL